MGIKCDNMAVVEVMASGRTRYQILGACSRNIWMFAVLYNISIHVEHIAGKTNVVAYLLSRYLFDNNAWNKLLIYLDYPVWIPTNIDLT